jgi:glycine/betaine/sarcosine/D-proline reductase family selenoprotein B
MARALEEEGIPVAQLCTMVNVALGIGSSRVVPSRSVLYPTGDPELDIKGEQRLRRRLLEKALEAVRNPIAEATVFE